MGTITSFPPSAAPFDASYWDRTLLRIMMRREGGWGFRELTTLARKSGVCPTDVLAWLADARARHLVAPLGYASDSAGRPMGPLLWTLTERGRALTTRDVVRRPVASAA